MNGGYFPPGGGGGSFDPHSPGPIGDVTPSTVSATTFAATGNLTLGNTTSVSTSTPVTINSGGTYADTDSPAKAKWKLYDSGTGSIYGFGISLSQFNQFGEADTIFSWYKSGARVMGFDGSALIPASNTLAQRNGTNGQIFSVYATFTDTSNYSRFSIDTTGGFVNLIIDEAGSGSGTLSGIGGGVTGTAPTGGGATSGLVATTYIGIDQNNVLYTPPQWLTWRVAGTDYKIPLYV